MKRVLITGGTGFVGACLSRTLLEHGHEVHLLVRPGYNNWRIRSILNEVQLHIVNMENRESLETTLAAIHPEQVFHLVAYGAYPSQNDLQVMLRTNLYALVNLIEACLKTGFEAFINTGSSSEYGAYDHATRETDAPRPNSDYAVTKVSATLYASHIARSRNVNIQTLRLYSVYGAYEEPSRFIPRLVVAGMQGKYPPLADPQTGRDFVHVADVCRAYELCASSDRWECGGIYNVGTGIQSTIGDAVAIARELLGIQKEPRWASMPNRLWDTKTWVADVCKIRDEVKWEPRFTLKQGISDMIDWFRKNPDLFSYYQTMSQVPPG